MSAECRGINCALRFKGGVLDYRAWPLRDKVSAIEMNRIKSIELRRKSVMPPAMIGALCLSLVFVVGLAKEGWISIVPLVIQGPLQSLGVVVAVISLVVLVCRWFFGNITLKFVDASSITVRMVPINSAQRFVMLIQKHNRSAEDT